MLTKLAINIEIDDCQEKLEKDEKLEQLRHVSGGERLTAQNLGSRYDPSSVRKRGASKKRLPPIPLWSPYDSAAGRWTGRLGMTRGLSISLSDASRTRIAESFQVVRIRAGFPRTAPGSTRVAICLGRRSRGHSWTQPLRW